MSWRPCGRCDGRARAVGRRHRRGLPVVRRRGLDGTSVIARQREPPPQLRGLLGELHHDGAARTARLRLRPRGPAKPLCIYGYIYCWSKGTRQSAIVLNGQEATGGAMTEPHDRDELVELMSRYANMPDTQNWDELPLSVLCDELFCDFSSLGTPVMTISREAWCQQSKQVFAGWIATHHAITNHWIVVDGDRATIRVHIRVEHWARPEVAAGEPNCWLVVGFYDNVAVRTPEGWRLSSIKLTATHQENEALLAATMAAVKD